MTGDVQTRENQRRVMLLSTVGGGPMERLVGQLNELGRPAHISFAYSPEGWRRRMSTGWSGRLRGRFGSMLWFPARALFESACRRRSVLVPTTNPFFLPFLLVATKALHRQPVVPLVYDLYPDALVALGLMKGDGAMARFMGWANGLVYSHADGVVFIGSKMAEHARRFYGQPRRWTVLETGAFAGEFDDPQAGLTDGKVALHSWCEGKIVVGYVGNMGQVHDWATLADAVPLLLQQTGKTIGVLVAGSGPGIERLKDAWAGLPRESVRFEGPLDDANWARVMRKIAISVVTLRPEAQSISIPSKAFSAMAAGSAILAIAPRESDIAEIILRHGCGLVVPPGDSTAALEALLDLTNNPDHLAVLRKRSMVALRSHYEMKDLATRWNKFLSDIPGAPH